MRNITNREIKNALKPWIWDLANNFLYELCRQHPSHRNRDEIVAKVLLIGRSNAAAIERRRGMKVRGDFYDKKVGPL